MTRDQFREGCLERDGHKCVICDETQNLSVHHIMERRLWDEGGYLLNNGATLCEQHHLQAESTMLSCEDIRRAAGIRAILLPDQLSQDNGEVYDKWGNQILPSGARIKGEMFWEESCRKALAWGGHLSDFIDKVKYPRTMHLPWSPGLKNDDRVITNLKAFEGEEVIFTMKMDGENATLARDYYHARSLDSKHHPSRDWLKALHGRIRHELPMDMRFTGENLYARHSIAYSDLPSYFLLFGVWEKGWCLSWDDTLAYAGMIGLDLVPQLYRGKFDLGLLKNFHNNLNPQKDEGFVIRVARAFKSGEFRKVCAKWVRKNHVGTSPFWMHQQVVPNQLSATQISN